MSANEAARAPAPGMCARGFVVAVVVYCKHKANLKCPRSLVFPAVGLDDLDDSLGIASQALLELEVVGMAGKLLEPLHVTLVAVPTDPDVLKHDVASGDG